MVNAKEPLISSNHFFTNNNVLKSAIHSTLCLYQISIEVIGRLMQAEIQLPPTFNLISVPTLFIPCPQNGVNFVIGLKPSAPLICRDRQTLAVVFYFLRHTIPLGWSNSAVHLTMLAGGEKGVGDYEIRILSNSNMDQIVKIFSAYLHPQFSLIVTSAY